MRDKKLLIFDLDGTLINSVPDLAIAINKMLISIDAEAIPVEQIKSFIGNGAKTLVERSLNHGHSIKETEELFDRAFQAFKSAYRTNPCDKTFLYPGVEETLTYLQKKDYLMTICTNKPVEFVEPILEKLDIKKFFTQWIGENSLPQKKPNGQPLLHLAERFNIPIDNCLMIGDSKNDIMAARNANIESVGVSYGYNYNENIKQYNPTIALDEFNKLQTLL